MKNNMIVHITESQLKHILSKELDEHYGIRYIEQWGENELLLPLFHHLYGLQNLGRPYLSLTSEECVDKVSQIIGGSKHSFMFLTNSFSHFTRDSKSTKRKYKPTSKQDEVFKKYGKYPKNELRKLCIDVLKEFEQDEKRKEKYNDGILKDKIRKKNTGKDYTRIDRFLYDQQILDTEKYPYDSIDFERLRSTNSKYIDDNEDNNNSEDEKDLKNREDAIRNAGYDPKKLTLMGSSKNNKKDNPKEYDVQNKESKISNDEENKLDPIAVLKQLNFEENEHNINMISNMLSRGWRPRESSNNKINESLSSVIREIKQNRRKNRY
jgi:hypothetical protein